MSVWFYKTDGSDLFKAGVSDKLDDFFLAASAEHDAHLIEVEKVKEAIRKAAKLTIPPEVLQTLQDWIAGKDDSTHLFFYVE